MAAPQLDDGFTALYGAGRGRSERHTLGAVEPSAEARAQLQELIRAGRVVRDETLSELYRHRSDVPARPLIAELEREIIASMVRIGRAHFHRHAQVVLKAGFLRDGVHHDIVLAPDARGERLRSRPLDAQALDQVLYAPAPILHWWPQGDVEPLPDAGRKLQLGCGQRAHTRLRVRARTLAEVKRGRAPRALDPVPVICGDCLRALPASHPLRSAAAPDSGLWSSSERKLFAAAAKHAVAGLLRGAFEAGACPRGEAVRQLAYASWQTAFCEHCAAWAEREAARILCCFALDVGVPAHGAWRAAFERSFAESISAQGAGTDPDTRLADVRAALYAELAGVEHQAALRATATAKLLSGGNAA